MVKPKQAAPAAPAPKTLETVDVALKHLDGRPVFCPKCGRGVNLKHNAARRISYAVCEGMCHITTICNSIASAYRCWDAWALEYAEKAQDAEDEQDAIIRRLSRMAVKMKKAGAV